MFPIVIRSAFILLNLISFSLGVISIVSLLLVPEEYDSSEWQIRNLLIYTILFVIVSKLGIIGSYFMCKLCLIVYTTIMLLFIGFNYLSWFLFPKNALIEAPIEFILLTSLFDLLELICALYLIFIIRSDQHFNKITPLKTINNFDNS